MAAGTGANTQSTASSRAPATSVGGARTSQLARRSGASSQVARQPTSGRKAAGGGILKFYTDDAPGLKVGPTTVLVLSLVFMGLVVSLHILGKFRSSA